MRIAVLSSPSSWHYRDLSRAGGPHNIVALPFSQISSFVSGKTIEVRSGEVELSQFDGVLVRTMPPGSLEQIVFRMDALDQLATNGVPVINPPRAIEIAVDKFLSAACLHRANIKVPESSTCQSVGEAMEAFEAFGRDVVLKPIFGSEGRGITRITDEAIALRGFKLLVQTGAVIHMQRFITHRGSDIRVLVIGDSVFGMRRINDSDWRTNVSRGARTEPINVDDDLAESAIQAARSVKASLAGIDFLTDENGTRFCLEVNAVPGWKALSRTLNIDVASQVIEHILQSAQ